MSDFIEQKHQELLLTQAQCLTSEGINTSLTEIMPKPTNQREAGIILHQGSELRHGEGLLYPAQLPRVHIQLWRNGENVRRGLCSQELKTLVKKKW